jgi:drug/metabolite transporter (DMT)-like permease
LQHHQLRDYGFLLLLAVVWGSAFALIKIAVDTISPLSMVAARIALAAILLYIIARVAGETLPGLKNRTDLGIWGHFLAVGMIGNGIPFTLVSWGELEVSSSLAAILIAIMPVFTVALARATGIEAHIGWRRISGICVGLAALVVLMGPAALGEMGGRAILAQLAVAGAAVSYAATAVYVKKLTFTVPTLTLAAATMIASALVMVPLALIFDQPWHLRPSTGAIMAVVTLGILPTALAAIVYIRLLVTAGPTFASMINFLIPAFGAIVGIFWLGETLGPREIIALSLILAAIGLVRNSPRRASSSTN